MPGCQGSKRRVRQKPSGVNNQYILVSCTLATSSPGAGSPQSLNQKVLIYFAHCWAEERYPPVVWSQKGNLGSDYCSNRLWQTPVYSHPCYLTSSIPAPSRGAGFKSGSFLAFLTTNLNFQITWSNHWESSCFF